jgi:glucose-1-phosphate thymidylyltransferase
MIGKDTHITASKLIGPAFVGCNCTIGSSTIGPYTSISDNCTITDSVLSNSVIQGNCQISGLSAGLVESVLGESVQIRRDGPVAGPLRVILGDMAQVIVSK